VHEQWADNLQSDIEERAATTHVGKTILMLREAGVALPTVDKRNMERFDDDYGVTAYSKATSASNSTAGGSDAADSSSDARDSSSDAAEKRSADGEDSSSDGPDAATPHWQSGGPDVAHHTASFSHSLAQPSSAPMAAACDTCVQEPCSSLTAVALNRQAQFRVSPFAAAAGVAFDSCSTSLQASGSVLAAVNSRCQLESWDQQLGQLQQPVDMQQQVQQVVRCLCKQHFEPEQQKQMLHAPQQQQQQQPHTLLQQQQPVYWASEWQQRLLQRSRAASQQPGPATGSGAEEEAWAWTRGLHEAEGGPGAWDWAGSGAVDQPELVQQQQQQQQGPKRWRRALAAAGAALKAAGARAAAALRRL
jgi:hypothetical protein